MTFEGECQGNLLVYCDPDTNTVQMVDCADVSETAACTEIDPSYGVDCALAVDEGCVDEDGEIYLCQGTAPGCYESPEGAVCDEDLGPCTEDDIDTCDGDRWIFECTVNQPYVVDCAAYGGRCGTDPGRCYDLPSGSFCDETFSCADGLLCSALGFCERRATPDAGVSTPDAGVSAADAGQTAAPDKDGCTCLAPSGTSTGGLALLALLALGRRRRHG